MKFGEPLDVEVAAKFDEVAASTAEAVLPFAAAVAKNDEADEKMAELTE